MNKIVKILENDINAKICDIQLKYNIAMADRHVHDDTDIEFKKYTNRSTECARKRNELTDDTLKTLEKMTMKELLVLDLIEYSSTIFAAVCVVSTIARKIQTL